MINLGGFFSSSSIFGLANTKQQVFFDNICHYLLIKHDQRETTTQQREINLILSFVSFDVVLLFGPSNFEQVSFFLSRF